LGADLSHTQLRIITVYLEKVGIFKAALAVIIRVVFVPKA
jgi:hypothetical protein